MKSLAVNSALRVRELYNPAHMGNSSEVAGINEMREFLQEAKWWGYNRYTDWFDAINVCDPNNYGKNHPGHDYDLTPVLWERKLDHYATAAALGFELGLLTSPNHVFLDQMLHEKPAVKGDRVFGQLICPADASARRTILSNHEYMFDQFAKRGLKLKALGFAPYDYGGCLCDSCQPWIITFGKLSLEIGAAAREYFPAIELDLFGWWWTEEEHSLFRAWTKREAEGAFRGMNFQVRYGESSYDTAARPMPAGASERAFIHTSYSEEPAPRSDHYGHYGVCVAPERLERTVRFLQDRGADGFLVYSEGFLADINNAIMCGLATGKFASADEVLVTYAERYFGNEPERWAQLIRLFGLPFSMDLKYARKEFDCLSKKAKDSWRLRQLECKLRLLEADARVAAETEWNEKRLQAADEFWLVKEELWRKVWGLGLSQHVFAFNRVYSCPPWATEYWQIRNKRKDDRKSIDAKFNKEA